MVTPQGGGHTPTPTKLESLVVANVEQYVWLVLVATWCLFQVIDFILNPSALVMVF